jgi:hypothetical protein
VYALTVYQNALIAGGQFTNAGGVSAAHIGRWDGESWTALGDGIDGTVEALSVHNGTLFAGGDFDRAGAATANNVARWDGVAWAPRGIRTGRRSRKTLCRRSLWQRR